MAEHMLGLPLKHKIKDIKGLFAELQTLMKLDGSRKMLGTFDMNEWDIINVGGMTMLWDIDMQGNFITDLGEIQTNGNLEVGGDALLQGLIRTKSNIQPYSVQLAGLVGTASRPYVGLTLGQTASLPSPSATYRGQFRVKRGTSGNRDRVYVCLKSDAGVYSWVEIANGGA